VPDSNFATPTLAESELVGFQEKATDENSRPKLLAFEYLAYFAM
jgi:hypothetical protein